jgi:hypothetical protein
MTDQNKESSTGINLIDEIVKKIDDKIERDEAVVYDLAVEEIKNHKLINDLITQHGVFIETKADVTEEGVIGGTVKWDLFYKDVKLEGCTVTVRISNLSMGSKSLVNN